MCIKRPIIEAIRQIIFHDIYHDICIYSRNTQFEVEDEEELLEDSELDRLRPENWQLFFLRIFSLFIFKPGIHFFFTFCIFYTRNTYKLQKYVKITMFLKTSRKLAEL